MSLDIKDTELYTIKASTLSNTFTCVLFGVPHLLLMAKSGIDLLHNYAHRGII